jgi:hypothetical protein
LLKRCGKRVFIKSPNLGILFCEEFFDDFYWYRFEFFGIADHSLDKRKYPLNTIHELIYPPKYESEGYRDKYQTNCDDYIKNIESIHREEGYF